MLLDHWMGRGRIIIVGALLAAIVMTAAFEGCSSKKDPPTVQKSPDNWSFVMLSGNGQTVHSYDTLQNRLVVQLKDGLGEPIFNQQLRFELVKGNGEVFAKPVAGGEAAEVLMPTDWLGKAGVNFRNFSAGENLVLATVVSKPTLHVTFTVQGI